MKTWCLTCFHNMLIAVMESKHTHMFLFTFLVYLSTLQTLTCINSSRMNNVTVDTGYRHCHILSPVTVLRSSEGQTQNLHCPVGSLLIVKHHIWPTIIVNWPCTTSVHIYHLLQFLIVLTYGYSRVSKLFGFICMIIDSGFQFMM